MVNGNSYPLSSVLWISAAENDSCGPRQGRCGRNQRGGDGPTYSLLRDALFNQLESDPRAYWHRPTVVRDMKSKLGDVISRMKVAPERPGDDVIDHDLILVWGAQRRIITGADLLGRLLRDIVPLEGEKAASLSKS